MNMDIISHSLQYAIAFMLAFSTAGVIFGIIYLVLLVPLAVVFLLSMFIDFRIEFEDSKMRFSLGWSRPRWKTLALFPFIQLVSYAIFIGFFMLEGWYITTYLVPLGKTPSDVLMILIASALSMIPVMMWSGWAYSKFDKRFSFVWAFIVGGILQTVTAIGGVAIVLWMLIQKSQG